MVKIIYRFPFFLFLLLSAILIFSWFRFGHIYGGGDTGIPTYNPIVAASGIASNIWWDSLAPGTPVAQGLTSAPMLFFLSIPQALGASPVFIQALLFFILLFLMGYGMYLLSLSIFGKSKPLLAIAAGVFYLFNPYMMIQIWHRFIYNAMFLVAFLPFLVMTWLLWIRKRRPKYLLLFLFTNFLAVYIFGTIAFIVAVWALLFFLTLLESLIPWKGKKEASGLFLAFFIGCLFWLLTNSWWLIPTFSVSPALFAEVHTTDDSLSTLTSLSDSTILSYTLRLINPFYLYWQADFGTIYQNIAFQFISWLFVLVTFVGFISGLKKKAYTVWSLLFLIVIFLAKGAAPPFNFPYIFGFSHFFPLGVIRNPFEKLGILLPFIYAILFALGLQFLLSYSIKYIGKSKTIFLLTVFIILHMVFFWPMFAGKLFGTLDKQNFVEVPKSYTEADEWIGNDVKSTNSTDGRILHLPLPRSEDVTYNWEYGYHGVEPSAAIFTSLPSIARRLDTPRIGDALSALSLIFHRPYATDQAIILKMLKDFSVRYIILHKDIEWKGGGTYSPLETETVLAELGFLEKKQVFGNLILYKLKDSYFSPKVVISDNIKLFYPSQKNLFWPWMVGTSSAEIVSTVSPDQDSNILDKVNEIIIMPEESTVVKNIELPTFQGNLEAFNNISILPNSPLYFLIDAKERLSLIGRSKAQQQEMKIIFAEKRLVEMYKIKRMRELKIIDQKTGDSLVISAIKKYQGLISDVFKNELLINSVIIGDRQASLLEVFVKHLSLLTEFTKGSYDNEEAKKIAKNTILVINRYLVKKGLSSNYPLIDEKGLSKDYRQQYTFNIPFKSSYNLLMNGLTNKSLYPNNLFNLTFQINNNLQKSQEEDLGSIMSFGKYEMEEGTYQISTPRLNSVNLLPRYTEWNRSGNVSTLVSTGIIEMSSESHSVSFIEGTIKPVSGGDTYLFGFDLKIRSGRGVRVQIIQDTDRIDEKTNKLISRYDGNYVPNNVDQDGWNHFEAIITLSQTTQNAKLKIQAEPWDDCLTVLGDKERCADKEIKEIYNQSSQLLIKNISVVRLLDNFTFLSADISNDAPSISSGTVSEVKKQNSSQYFGKVKITKPTFIFFKESFNPGWELKLMRDKQVYQPSQHLVGNLFSNAWFVEQTGDYDFTLTFSPQKLVYKGILLAFVGWVIVLTAIVMYNFYNIIVKK